MADVRSIELEHSLETPSRWQFKTTIEILFVYVAAFLTFLLFFDSLNYLLYTFLGLVALFMFLSVAVLMLGYISYNFYEIF
ncbi:MAG: hypothetical protein ACXAC7_17350, partial [Candidatus Hodarchaeales archaeon]